MRTKFIALFSVLCLPSTMVFAGQPFLTDDPSTTEYKHWEAYLQAFSNEGTGGYSIIAPSVEIDYGARPNLELNITLQTIYNKSFDHSNNQNGFGFGDTELGATYRFIEESTYIPQVAITPSYFIASGDVRRGLGNGRPYLSLPIWAQKSWGEWTSYGGGGYTLNSGKDELNFYFGGIVVQKDLSEKWTVGGELYWQGADAKDTGSSTLINFGAYYNITKDLVFLFSAGHSIAGEVNYVNYVGFDKTW